MWKYELSDISLDRVECDYIIEVTEDKVYVYLPVKLPVKCEEASPPDYIDLTPDADRTQ